MALLMKPEPFSRDLDRVFDAFFGQTEQQARRWVPPMDLVEAEDHFILKADLPRRVKMEAIFHLGSFNRSLTLPDGVDADRIEASFLNGVLEVRIPKPEERKPRRIEIAAAKAKGNGTPAAVEGSAKET